MTDRDRTEDAATGATHRYRRSVYELRFQLVDEAGQPVHQRAPSSTGFPYKALPSGTPNSNPQRSDARTDGDGKTEVVSTQRDERVDFYLCWSKLMVEHREK